MKWISFTALLGFIILYFIDAAFKLSIFNGELFVHSAIRFVTGFILVGVGVFYTHKLGLKSAAFLILAIVLTDDVLDFFRKVEDFRFEIILLSIYMLAWGSVMGYVCMKKIAK
jgi:hypothetical protein